MSRHGTVQRRKDGCRCADCEAAWAQYLDRQAAYRERRRREGGPGLVRNVSETRPQTCRCDAPIGTGDCLKCGREIACSAA